MTAAHIINRLHVQVLGNKTPYEALCKQEPKYNHLKVLGCLAFAYNPEHSSDKFFPRGVPCVFMGYPPTQKGFKLLNLVSMQMFISRDVTFHEVVFPFNTKTAKSYMQPIPDPKPTHTKPSYDDEWFENYELESPQTTSTPAYSPPTSPISAPQNSASQDHPSVSQNTSNIHTTAITNSPEPRRPTRTRQQHAWLQQYHLGNQNSNFATVSNVTNTELGPAFFYFLANLTQS